MKLTKQLAICGFLILMTFFAGTMAFAQTCNCWVMPNQRVDGNFHMIGGGTGTSNFAFRINNLADDGGRFRIDADGRVSINVTDADKGAPSFTDKKLIVNGKTYLKSSLVFGPETSYDQLVLYDDGIGKSVIKGDIQNITYAISPTLAQHRFIKRTYAGQETELMRIQSDGNVGIGTNAPETKLHVKEGAIMMQRGDVKMWMNNTSSGDGAWFGTNSNHKLHIGANNSGAMTVDVNGNIGVNNTSPSAKLDVVGDLRFDGVLSMPKTTSYIQLGAEVAGKESAAGQIAYQKWTTGLDIVGAGTSQGTRKVTFHSQGGIIFYNGVDMTDNTQMNVSIGKNTTENASFIGTSSNHDLDLGVGANTVIRIKKNGTAFIGWDAYSIPAVRNEVMAKYELFVNRGVLSEDFAMAPVDQWSDYVFDKNYKLKPLSEVETYIKANQHLPGIPSAQDVKKDGYSVKDMNVKFLEKIEELTLYSIGQDKKIKELEKQVQQYEHLAAEVEKLKEASNKK